MRYSNWAFPVRTPTELSLKRSHLGGVLPNERMENPCFMGCKNRFSSNTLSGSRWGKLFTYLLPLKNELERQSRLAFLRSSVPLFFLPSFRSTVFLPTRALPHL